MFLSLFLPLLSSPPCDGSALVRCGGTAAVAAVTFEVAAASEPRPRRRGPFRLCRLPAALRRPGPARRGGAGARDGPERLRGLAASVLSDLRACASVDEAGGALCIKRGVAVFVAKVDVSFLSWTAANGGSRFLPPRPLWRTRASRSWRFRAGTSFGPAEE